MPIEDCITLMKKINENTLNVKNGLPIKHKLNITTFELALLRGITSKDMSANMLAYFTSLVGSIGRYEKEMKQISQESKRFENLEKQQLKQSWRPELFKQTEREIVKITENLVESINKAEQEGKDIE